MDLAGVVSFLFVLAVLGVALMADDDDQPRNVKDLLVEAKDVSELMVDLAYAAVFFNEEDLAEEVEVLEDQHGRLPPPAPGDLHACRARPPRTPKPWAGCCTSPAPSRRSATRPSDIARVVRRSSESLPRSEPDLRHADEIVGRVRVREGAPCVGQSLGDLLLPSETGMWLIAIRRGNRMGVRPPGRHGPLRGRRPALPGAGGRGQPDPRSGRRAPAPRASGPGSPSP